jgi:hypothetical protein
MTAVYSAAYEICTRRTAGKGLGGSHTSSHGIASTTAMARGRWLIQHDRGVPSNLDLREGDDHAGPRRGSGQQAMVTDEHFVPALQRVPSSIEHSGSSWFIARWGRMSQSGRPPWPGGPGWRSRSPARSACRGNSTASPDSDPGSRRTERRVRARVRHGHTRHRWA